MSLIPKTILSLIISYLFLILTLFLPAGTISYPDGWAWFVVFFCGTTTITAYFLMANPDLIERRTKSETEKIQIWIQSLNGFLFILMLVIPGLDFRYRWSTVPIWSVILGNLIMLGGFVVVFMVFKQNAYLANTIVADKNQTVISTGLYAYVRHPMYSGAYLIILSTPLALGSWYAFIPAAFMCILIFIRAVNEEKTLSRDLQGYDNYLRKTRFRFIRYII